MLQRVAKYTHKNHVIMIVARRADVRSLWSASYAVICANGRFLPALRDTSELFPSHHEATQQARERACDEIDRRSP